MKTLPKYTIPTYDEGALAVNQRTDFTRRIPTGLSDRQMARDAKIAVQIIRAYESGDLEKVVDIFVSKSRLLSNPRYWELLRTVWVAAGSTETAPLFRRLMSSQRPCRSWFMTPEDAAALDAMTFPLLVYRAYDAKYGTVNCTDPGISWTLDDVWCADYAHRKGRIIRQRYVQRADVFAYVSRRGEEEIISLTPDPILSVASLCESVAEAPSAPKGEGSV